MGYLEVSVRKIYDYELKGDGYKFQAAYVPVQFIRTEELSKPICRAGQYYFFGFSFEELYHSAEATKKELDNALRLQLQWVKLSEQKLKEWDNLPSLIHENTSTSQKNQQSPSTQDNQPVKGALPEAGTWKIISATAQARENGACVGYCAILVNGSTGKEEARVSGGGKATNLQRVFLRSIRDVIQKGKKLGKNTTICICTSDSTIVEMFQKGYLRVYANRGWKTKNGSELPNLDFWKVIWKYTAEYQMTAKLCSESSPELYPCYEVAMQNAEQVYQLSLEK